MLKFLRNIETATVSISLNESEIREAFMDYIKKNFSSKNQPVSSDKVRMRIHPNSFHSASAWVEWDIDV